MRSSSFGLIPLCLLTLLAGCQNPPRNSASVADQIDVKPSFAVQYATDRVSPAVVQLDVVTEEFSRGQSRPQRSLGSGFIIDKEGHVLTNFHVAGRAKRIDITLANQEHVKATLLGSDHWTDLAVVQLDMDDIRQKNLSFDVAALGTSSNVMLGQPVMAVGTPYGLSRTVTAGIVSQTDRAFAQSNIEGYETGWFNNWIQTDAAINPGNSGGPLINLRGEVIGINTRGVPDGNNLGFAIPIDTAREIFPELLRHKKVTRSYVGLVLQPLQDLEKYYDIQGNKGVLISSVEKDSPAELAGLKPEDILLSVNGKETNARFPEQLAAVRKLIADFPVGTKLTLTYRRGGPASLTTSATPTATAPASSPALAAATRDDIKTLTVTTDKLESVITDEKALTAWGMTVRDLTRAYLRDARLLSATEPRVEGVLVLTLQTGLPAERASLQPYDIIQTVNGKKVTTVEELQAALADWQQNPRMIAVEIRRGSRAQLTLSLKP
jgi:serine protease Do